MSALQLAISMECFNGSLVRLVFIKAVITPILERPSHIQTYSGRDSSNKAIASPRLKPSSLKKCAILLLYSSTWKTFFFSINILINFVKQAYLLKRPLLVFEIKSDFFRMFFYQLRKYFGHCFFASFKSTDY